MTNVGPVELMAIAFDPGSSLEGRVMTELVRLEHSGTIRLLDLLFVRRDRTSGDLLALDYQGEDLGGIIGALLGFDFENADEQAASSSVAGCNSGLSREQTKAIGAQVRSGQSAVFLLVEHLWAKRFMAVTRDAGAIPLGEGFLTPEAIAAVGRELEAIANLLDEVETEEDDTEAVTGLGGRLGGGGLMVARAGARIGPGSRYRSMSRMRRRQSAAGERTGARPDVQPAPTRQEDLTPRRAGRRGALAYAAELEKLVQLRDHGVITAEDFEAKKKQILGI